MVDGGTYWLNAILHPGAIVFIKMGAKDRLFPAWGRQREIGGCRGRKLDAGSVTSTVGAGRPHRGAGQRAPFSSAGRPFRGVMPGQPAAASVNQESL